MSFCPDPKVKTPRSKPYRKWIEQEPCEVPDCYRSPCDAAHCGQGGERIKASDYSCLPLCSGLDGHHMEQHRIGKLSFAKKYGIDYERSQMRLMEKYIVEVAA